MDFRKIIYFFTLSSTILTILQAQFVDVSFNLDNRQVRENEKYLFDTIENDIANYFTTNRFMEGEDELELLLDLHVVIESISHSGNAKIVSAQLVLTNRLDQHFFAKGVDFPYSKGKSVAFTPIFDPLASILDYYAYLFIATELDTYDYMGGDSYLVKAEEIASQGRDSDHPRGWDDRWKKVRRIKENHHLRTIRYNFFAALDESNLEEPNTKKITQYMDICYESLLSVGSIYGSERNSILFLNTYAQDIAFLFYTVKMDHAVKYLVKYNPENKAIYSEYLK